MPPLRLLASLLLCQPKRHTDGNELDSDSANHTLPDFHDGAQRLGLVVSPENLECLGGLLVGIEQSLEGDDLLGVGRGIGHCVRFLSVVAVIGMYEYTEFFKPS